MNLFSKEFYDIMEQFERDYPYFRKEKEPTDLWKSGNFYCHEKTNDYFLAYRHGYSFSKAIHSVEKTPAELAAGEMVEALAQMCEMWKAMAGHIPPLANEQKYLNALEVIKKARGEK